MRSLLFIYTVLTALLTSLSVSAQELTLRNPGVQTDGEVYALTQSQGRLFIGGNFSQVGFRTGSGSVLRGSDGQPDLPFGAIEGEVRAAVPDQEGGWYIGGSFTSVGGTPRNGLARIRADKTLDLDWNPGLVGTAVNALAVRSGVVYIGGNFTVVGGQSRNNLAAVDATTGQATTWNPVLNGEVRALALHRDSLYVGGNFTTVNAAPRGRLAGFNVTTTQILDQPAPNLDGAVNAIVVDSEKGMIFVGGDFANDNAVLRLRLAQYNLAGTLQSLAIGFNNTVHTLRLIPVADCPLSSADGALLVVGGAFSNSGGESRNRLASLYPYAANGPALTSWAPTANGPVRALTHQGCELYVAGDFTSVNGVTRNYIAAINLSGGDVNTQWNPNADNGVRVLSKVGTRIFAGGSFTSVGRVSRRNLASVNLSTLTFDDWGLDTDGPVNALLASSSSIYFGGSFSRIGDEIRNNVARASITTGTLSTWNPNPNGPVHALAQGTGSRIFIGGQFTRCGALDVTNLANVNEVDGQALSTWKPNPSGPVYALALNGINLYVGGDFTDIAGQDIFRNLCKINASTALADVNWVANTDNPVRALAVYNANNRLYVGGEFLNVQRIDGTQELISYAVAVRLDDASIYDNWRPTVDRPVRAIAMSPNSPHVFLGGDFQLAPGLRVASVDTVNGATGAFNGRLADGIVRALLYNDRSLFVGGTFTSINGVSRRSLAEFTNCTTTLNIEADRNAICPGESANLKAIASGFGFFTYSWSPNTGLRTSNNGREAEATPFATTTYTLVVTDGENCKAVNHYTVTVNQAPNARAGNVPAVCPNAPVRLSATGGVKFIWSVSPGPTIFSREAEPIVNPSATTTYTVLVTDDAGCTSATTVTATVNPQPELRAESLELTVCNDAQADSVLLEVSGAVTYAWTPATGLSATSIAQPKARPSADTEYQVIGTDANGCSDTLLLNVRVGAPPTVQAAVDRAQVCARDTVRLTATGSADVRTFVWEPFERFADPFGEEQFDLPNDTTKYTITAFGEFCSRTATVDVNVLERPVVEAGPSVAICRGVPFQINAQITDADVIQWLPDYRLSATDVSNPIADPAMTTTYTVTVTNSTTGCTQRDQISLIVLDLPTVNAGGNQLVCDNVPAQLSAAGGPTVRSYLWYAPTQADPIGNSSDVSVRPTATSTYTVLVSDENGCEASDAVTVVVSRRPVPGLGSDLRICQGTSAPLLARDGEVYRWQPEHSLNDPNIPNPIATPNGTTTYTVNVTNVDGCSATARITVFVLPAPPAYAGNDTVICRSGTVMLRGSGGVMYSWEPVELIQGPSNIANPVVRPVDNLTVFTMTVTDENSCTASSQVSVALRDLPVVDAGPDIAGKCPFAEVQLNVAPEGVRYLWTPPFDLNSDTIRNPITTTQISRRYTVYVTDDFGCIGQDDVLIEVDTVIRVDAGADVAVCRGDSIALQAEEIGMDPRWEPTRGLSDHLARNPRVSPDSTTVYYYYVTGENGCEGRDSLTVSIHELPMPVMGADTTVCPGGQAQLSAAGGEFYDWSPAESLDDARNSRPVAGPDRTTTYYVTVTDTNGCSAIGRQTVTIFVPPIIELLPPEGDTTFCGEAGSVRIATHPRPTYRYQWLRDGEPIMGAEASAYTAEEAGVYRVRVRVGECETESRNINIVVFPRPNANAGPDRQVCIGAQGAPLEASGGVNYRWEPTTGLNNANIASPVANPERTTTYTVTVTDGNGCQAQDDVTVYANRVRSITASAKSSTTICEGSRVELTATAGPGFRYQWKRNGVAIPDGALETYFASSTGVYTVEVSLPGCNPIESNQVRVDVLPQPLVQVSGATTICFGSTTQLRAEGGTSYQWLPTRGLSDPTAAAPFARPDQTTTYTVAAINAAGCSTTAAVTVTVADFAALPRPQILPGRSVSICPGTSTELRARNNAEGFAVTYQWRRNNVDIPGATQSTYTASEMGLYTVAVSSATCGTSASEPTRLDFRPIPVLSNVIKNASCAACADGEIAISASGGLPPYRYSLDGRNFYSSRIFVNLTRGDYTVTVRDSAGCLVAAEVQVGVEPTSRKATLDESNVSVYPNPTRGQITVSIKNPPLQPIQVSMYDLLGKRIMSQRVMPAGSIFDYEIDMTDRASGVYFLTLILPDGKKLTRKVVKE